MITLQLYKLESGDQKALRGKMSELRVALEARFKPLISPSIATVSDLFGVSPAKLRAAGRAKGLGYLEGPTDAIDGDVYCANSTVFSVGLFPPPERQVTFGYDRTAKPKKEPTRVDIAFVSRSWAVTEISSVLAIFKDVFGEQPTPFSYASKRFDELKQEGRSSPEAPTDMERKAIKVLQQKEVRALAIAIKTAGGLLIRDLSKQLAPENREKADDLVATLKKTELVDSEIVIVCSKSQAQIARVPSKAAIVEMARHGMKCACGRAISEERIEEALTVTDLARNLLDKARWMTTLLIEALARVGVPRSGVLVEQSVGGDEIDCLANISGELVLFELKDKEFSLGNAYSFGAKVAIVQPKHKVIVTTEHVGGDAKEHFNRARQAETRDRRMTLEVAPNDVIYVEGIDRLDEGLEALADSIYRSDAIRALDRVLPLALLSGQALVSAFESRAPTTQEQEAVAAKVIPNVDDNIQQVPDPAHE